MSPNIDPPKPTRVLFDEWHSESWSCARERAREIQPEDPIGSSYQRAADALAARDFTIERNTAAPLSEERLAETEVLVIAHPCDSRWERTTSVHSPTFSPDELAAITAWVKTGGGLLIITEYEHDKYGDNLNDLIAPAGLRIENGKVFDRSACVNENPEWFIASPADDSSPLAHLAREAVFYRAGWCVTTDPEAQIAWSATTSAYPPSAGVIATASLGAGRIVVVTDSVLFGDERIGEHDHTQLWLNLLYWLAAPKSRLYGLAAKVTNMVGPSYAHWPQVKTAVNCLRQLQEPDGSIVAEHQPQAFSLVEIIRQHVTEIARQFAHESEYFVALDNDLRHWLAGGMGRPDFSVSLAAFTPQRNRRDGREIFALFPMYTPNASSDTRFEALLFQSPWPGWLAALESTRYRNDRFVPGHLIDFTDGFASECAVFFPEMIALKSRPTNHFATIFCDREAERLQRTTLAAADVVKLTLPPQLEYWLNSRPLIEDTVALWDLIHDTSHSTGELPFDPFLIRQRAPFWMYALEELRVDLRSYGEAQQLAEGGMPFARYVTYAILLDRLFRFPITGTRLRNYDALGGQLLFAFLHQRDVLVWSDNHLLIRWERLDGEIGVLRDEVRTLYRYGSDWSKMSFWLAAHDLIARYVRPNVASQWRLDNRAITDEADLKHWIDLVHPDEFPLGTFHLNLQRQIGKLPGYVRERALVA